VLIDELGDFGTLLLQLFLFLAPAPFAILPLKVAPDLLKVDTDKAQDIGDNFVARVQFHRAAHVESRNGGLGAECGNIESAEQIFRERFPLAPCQGCFVPHALTQNRDATKFIIKRSLSYFR
jgi:hypothetical protein